MKKKFIVLIKIFVILFFSVYLSTVVQIKKAVIEPDTLKPNMYIIHYDYYANCWGVIKGYNMNCNNGSWMKILSGPDPEKMLSSDLCYSNSFIIYGSIENIESYDISKVYSINSTGWDIIVQDTQGIRRSNVNCRPKQKKALTIYDYKWFDFIVQPEDYIF